MGDLLTCGVTTPAREAPGAGLRVSGPMNCGVLVPSTVWGSVPANFWNYLPPNPEYQYAHISYVVFK